MKYKNRVLHVMGALNMGGQETLIMNIYRKIDKKKIQFDFSVVSKEKGFYENEIDKLGGKIYHIVSSGENRVEYFKQMYKLFTQYDIIHIHTSSARIIFLVWLAKIAKCKSIIVHSHSTRCERIMIHKITRIMLQNVSITRLACSEEAGKWLFNKKDFIIIPNGIDVKKYQFDDQIKQSKKAELKLEDKYIIGHIGRFSEQKNHERLIKIFHKIAMKRKDIHLLLIGSGELEDKIKEEISNNGLDDRVTILKNRTDINELLQIMDVFVFPSKYEGLGIVLVEAQASGLKSIVSSNVPKQVDLTGTITFTNLKDSDEIWIKNIYANMEDNINRKFYNDIVSNSEYNITNAVKKLGEIYNIK